MVSGATWGAQACSNAAKTAPFNPMKANPRLFSNSLYDKADIPATWIFSGASALAPWAGAANSNHSLAATLLMRGGLLPYPPRLARWTAVQPRSEEHTSELQSLMRISYTVFCLTKNHHTIHLTITTYL